MKQSVKSSVSETDAEVLELLRKTSEQYRIYKELHDVANIGRKPAFPPEAAPTPDRPLTSGFFFDDKKSFADE